MPKRDPREGNWVPLVARVLCYMCGVHFEDERDKMNCRMCYDVFCPRCMAEAPIVLPSSYSYGDDPQPVCVMCDHLIHAFPMFAAQIHGQRGGQLIDRRYRVLTINNPVPLVPENAEGSSPSGSTASRRLTGGGGGRNIPSSAHVKKRKSVPSTAPKEQEEGGIIGSVKRFFGVGQSNTGSSNGAGRSEGSLSNRSFRSGGATSVMAPTPKGRQAMRADRATNLELHSWRPVSTDTALVCEGGETRIYLKEIKSVEFREHVVVTLSDNRQVEFIVVQLEVEHAGGSDGPNGGSGGSGGRSTLKFTKDDALVVDSSANYTLATGLISLVKLAKGHFALNPSASFAMHRDVQESAHRF